MATAEAENPKQATLAPDALAALIVTALGLAVCASVWLVTTPILYQDLQQDDLRISLSYVVVMTMLVLATWGQVLAVRALFRAGRRWPAGLALGLGLVGLNALALLPLLSTLNIYKTGSIFLNALYVSGVDLWAPLGTLLLCVGFVMRWIARHSPRRRIWTALACGTVFLMVGPPWIYGCCSLAWPHFQAMWWRGSVADAMPAFIQEKTARLAIDAEDEHFLDTLRFVGRIPAVCLRESLLGPHTEKRSQVLQGHLWEDLVKRYPAEAEALALEVLRGEVHANKDLQVEASRFMLLPEHLQRLCKALQKVRLSDECLKAFLDEAESDDCAPKKHVYETLEHNFWSGMDQRDEIADWLGINARNFMGSGQIERMKVYRSWVLHKEQASEPELVQKVMHNMVARIRRAETPLYYKRATALDIAHWLKLPDVKVRSPLSAADGKANPFDGAACALWGEGEVAEVERIAAAGEHWLKDQPKKPAEDRAK